jgi:hypothetical protein
MKFSLKNIKKAFFAEFFVLFIEVLVKNQKKANFAEFFEIFTEFLAFWM